MNADRFNILQAAEHFAACLNSPQSFKQSFIGTHILNCLNYPTKDLYLYLNKEVGFYSGYYPFKNVLGIIEFVTHNLNSNLFTEEEYYKTVTEQVLKFSANIMKTSYDTYIHSTPYSSVGRNKSFDSYQDLGTFSASTYYGYNLEGVVMRYIDNVSDALTNTAGTYFLSGQDTILKAFYSIAEKDIPYLVYNYINNKPIPKELIVYRYDVDFLNVINRTATSTYTIDFKISSLLGIDVQYYTESNPLDKAVIEFRNLDYDVELPAFRTLRRRDEFLLKVSDLFKSYVASNFTTEEDFNYVGGRFLLNKNLFLCELFKEFSAITTNKLNAISSTAC